MTVIFVSKFLTAFKILTVPRTFVFQVLKGSLYESETIDCAARWKIISGLIFDIIRSIFL